jgi:hypothetical protein
VVVRQHDGHCLLANGRRVEAELLADSIRDVRMVGFTW